ncbi:hypothetical protein WL40_30095 [Burkholderia ubonensis]|uniref:Uncharacterized protein n=1 Tax=Burkholderia ubonensis TaxID=101571 RepID=A0AAW3MX19_9BURK|nr:hypothetical protein WJ45_32695 [Burkholderia ubonensis]KVO10024.1 hypothetical protein WJ73_22680 [Burkholderia ubonensis]KVO22236.1 hypothetical protein WJ74_01405 [Burkholderia ubonensis]KVO34474.1 hypothetical protein WJ75_19575 [Burkholderia ubonensis]KVP63395.1 hypothetical protein WJ92_05260 [Burkholderia ubonensis]
MFVNDELYRTLLECHQQVVRTIEGQFDGAFEAFWRARDNQDQNLCVGEQQRVDSPELLDFSVEL